MAEQRPLPEASVDVQRDAAYLFYSDGFRMGGLLVAQNHRQRNALDFLLEAGVAYLDAYRGCVGYRRHGGEAIDCGARDLQGCEARLHEHFQTLPIWEDSPDASIAPEGGGDE